MLEGTAPRLMQPGGPHHDCPDKDPQERLRTIEAAGLAAVPFTTGGWVGTGRWWREGPRSQQRLAQLGSQVPLIT